MQLKGSCHCGAVKFRVQSDSPVPFMQCYCTICRKTAGGGGYAINLGGDARTMKVTGEKSIGIYHALLREKGKRTKRSPAKRHFCLKCGSALAMGPALARVDSPARVSNRHAAAEAPRSHRSRTRVCSELGRCAEGQEACALQGMAGGVAEGVASTASAAGRIE